MKLNELMKHIPRWEYLRICENGSIVGMGHPNDNNHDLNQHGHKTVGLFYIKNGVIEINVSSKKSD